MLDPPGDQLYVLPPDAVSVVFCPLQIVAALPVMVTVGCGLIVTVNVDALLLLLHPFASVPITVYVVAVVGLTTITGVVDPPGDQLYVLPPDAVRVALCPLQIDAEVPVMVMVGVAFTATAEVEVLVHPFPSVPVTVYVVPVVGQTVMIVVVAPPGNQLYVVPPDELSVVHCPLQIVLLVAFTEMTGVEFTVTGNVDVPVHPALKPVTV